jgi:glycosyltransferase involved in cell wall biosynthesis
MVPKQAAIQLYSHAEVFCCPSIYEPFGIINLEAMACRTAVVASAVGGIKEVVVPEQTGLLVDCELEPAPPFDPRDPDAFSAGLAAAVCRLMGDDRLRHEMAEAGRRRVEEHFTWGAIARQVEELYRQLPPTRA